MNIDKIVNLTPHDVTVQTTDGREVVIPRSGLQAYGVDQPSVRSQVIFGKDEIAVESSHVFSHVLGLPEDKETVILVSSAIGEWIQTRDPDRKNVYSPDTSRNRTIRENGRIRAVINLVRWA